MYYATKVGLTSETQYPYKPETAASAACKVLKPSVSDVRLTSVKGMPGYIEVNPGGRIFPPKQGSTALKRVRQYEGSAGVI